MAAIDIASARAATNELWDLCYVADTEDVAAEQAFRQFDELTGEIILAREVTGKVDEHDDWGAIEFPDGVRPAMRVISVLSLESWDGQEMIPEWTVRPVDPDEVVCDTRGRVIRLGDIIDLAYSAPAVGTRDGFGTDRNLIEPASAPTPA